MGNFILTNCCWELVIVDVEGDVFVMGLAVVIVRDEVEGLRLRL